MSADHLPKIADLLKNTPEANTKDRQSTRQYNGDEKSCLLLVHPRGEATACLGPEESPGVDGENIEKFDLRGEKKLRTFAPGSCGTHTDHQT